MSNTLLVQKKEEVKFRDLVRESIAKIEEYYGKPKLPSTKKPTEYLSPMYNLESEVRKTIIEEIWKTKGEIWKSVEIAKKDRNPIFINGKLNMENEGVKQYLSAIINYEKLCQLLDSLSWSQKIRPKEPRLLSPGTIYFTKDELTKIIDAGIVWVGLTKSALDKIKLTIDLPPEKQMEIEQHLKKIHGILLNSNRLLNNGDLKKSYENILWARAEHYNFLRKIDSVVEEAILKKEAKSGDVRAMIRLYGPVIDGVVTSIPAALFVTSLFIPDPRLKVPLRVAATMTTKVGLVWFVSRSVAQKEYAEALILSIPFIPLRVIPSTVMRHLELPLVAFFFYGTAENIAGLTWDLQKLFEYHELDPQLLASFLFLFGSVSFLKGYNLISKNHYIKLNEYANENFKREFETFLKEKYGFITSLLPKKAVIGFPSAKDVYNLFKKQHEERGTHPVHKYLNILPCKIRSQTAGVVSVCLVAGFSREEFSKESYMRQGLKPMDIGIAPAEKLTSLHAKLREWLYYHERIHFHQSDILINRYTTFAPLIEGGANKLALDFTKSSINMAYSKWTSEFDKLMKIVPSDALYVSFTNPKTSQEVKQYVTSLRNIANAIEQHRIELGNPQDYRNLATALEKGIKQNLK